MVANTREKVDPRAINPESHTPLSDVVVWASELPGSQYTHRTVMPSRTRMFPGMKVLLTITTRPCAESTKFSVVGGIQSPVGPVRAGSDEQAAAIPSAAATAATRVER